MAASAQAAVFTWSFAGVVTSGYDATGAFGPISADVSGLAWRARVRTDTGTPGASFFDGDAFSAILGSGPSTPVRVAFTLEGVTRVFGVAPPDPVLDSGNSTGDQAQVDGALPDFPYDEYFEIKADNELDYGIPQTLRFLNERIGLVGAGVGLNFLPGPEFTTLPSLTPPPADGLFPGSVTLFSSTTDRATGAELIDEDANALLQITSIVAGGGVPEPGAWTLMIVGLGAIGAIARRRRDAAEAFG
jgi:PEP-CTERM motif-containing protein